VRIEKRNLESPLAAHGLMHMVIATAREHKIPIRSTRCAVHVRNMAWNSAMNITAPRRDRWASNNDGKGELRDPLPRRRRTRFN